MPRPMRSCRTCGKEFESSPNDSTVNCPSCRNRPVAKVSRGSTTAANPSHYRMGYKDGKSGAPKRSVAGSYSLGYREGQEGKESRF